MTGTDRTLVIVALCNLAIYSPILLAFGAYVVQTQKEPVPLIWIIGVWHFLGMLLMLVAFYITLKDLFLRPFPYLSTRLKWLVLIVMTGGIGWFVYLRWYGFKPRPAHESISDAETGAVAIG